MKEKHLLTFVLLLWLFFPYGVFCQLPQEREERPLREEKLYQPTPTSKFSHRAGVFVGYDSNPRLSLERKGDVFEEFVYSLDYSKPLIEGLRLFFDYDLRFENYHEITDISNTLNHFRLGLDKKFSLCSVGVGYDAGLITYLNDDSDFLLHKGFVYLAKKIGAKTYHKLQFEQGAKDYFDISSLGDSLGSAQEKERLDRRLAARYSLSVRPNQKTKLGCEFEFSRNDSNARYLDFYDWLAYAPSASFDYQLLKDLYLLSRFQSQGLK